MSARRPLLLFLLTLFLWEVSFGADLASFYGNSYIHIPFKEAKSTTEIQFKFRTLLPNALILLVAGTTDFCIVRIDRGRLKVNINLGAGESELISPPNLLLNDLKWHNVSIYRKDANLLLIIDNDEKIQKNLPGRFFELNIHFGLFVGGHGNFSELFFGHLEKFRGCISDLHYNGMHAIEEAHNRHVNTIVESVTWSCAAEFESDRNHPISFVKDNSFMYLYHNIQHKEVKIQFDLRTMSGQGVLFYNTGRLSKPDFFVIYVWEDTLRVTVKHEDKLVEIVNDFNVTDGEWHKVSFHQTVKQFELSVDERINNLENNGNIFSLSDSSFVGGLEMIKLSRAMSNGCKYCDLHFKGCLRNLFIAHKQSGIPDAHVTQGLIPGCVWKYPCKQNPCTESSSCVQHGIDSFKCECNDKFCVNQNYTDTYRVYSQNNLATELELLSVKPLKVMEGGNAVVTTENLNMILDYQKYGIQDSGVLFHIIEGPTHGTINVWPQDSNRFTLSEVANDKVHYIHDGLENFQDNIVVELMFKPTESFVSPSYLQGNFMFSMAINIISVNDPPKLGVKNGTVLRVVQGSKTLVSNEILNGEDPDSSVEKLVYSIAKNEVGHFENKLKPGVEISTFTQEDVNKENIYFVSKPNQVVNDSYISLQISDGLETSKPYRLRVTVSPQYWRLQNNTGLTLLHQNFGLITPMNLSFVSNVANADYRAQFRVTKKPNFGVVEAEVTANNWKIVDVFSTSDLKQHRVRYRHVAGKPDIDEFQFQTTFDKSSLYTFRIHFVRCTLHEINTKPIFMNETQEMMISKQYLSFETQPIRTISTSIRYVITKPPKYGILSSSVSKYTLKTCDTFTQEDIYSTNLKYKLFHKSYSYVQDTFSFIVLSPGCNNITGNMTVIFYPSLDTKSKVLALLHPLSLGEGEQKIIDGEHFNFKTDFLKNVTFNITQAPLYGFLQLIKDNQQINYTKSFSLIDVKEKRLSYIHDDSENDHDVFKFLALSPEDDFQFVGEYNINIVMKNDNRPVRKVDKVFHVVVGGEKLITGDDLEYVDKDIHTLPSKIIYSCHEAENGHFYNVKNAKQRIKEFTQEDLNERRILFKHQGAEKGKVKLWVTDGQFHIDSVLEIQASAPFIKIIMKKKLIVEYGKSAVITDKHLSYFTNLNAGDSDMIYEIILKPSFGKIAATNNRKALSTFTQKDINKGYISYINDESSANGDEISLRAKCKDAVSVAQMGVWMLPNNYWEPFKDKGSKKLQVEEATSALITKKILEISQTNVPPLSITYYVCGIPLNGYLTILSNTNDTDKDIINVFSFTQDLINEKRVLYIQSGANETSDKISFNVTNGIIWLENVELNIEIIPERLYLGTSDILVDEGETATITPANLFVITNYYKKKISDYVILQDALHGCIQIHKRCNKFSGFSQKELLAGVVRYAHDGSENLTDEITLVAVAAQKRSIPITLKIVVTPVNDNEPKLVNNTGLMMWEGGNAIITHEMLGVVDADVPKDVIYYQVLGSWWGNVVLMSDVYAPITNFTQDLINQKTIGFHHENGTEAKFKFSVTDGRYKTQDFYFIVKTKPVRISMRTKPLHIFPLQRKYLTNSHMIACVSDNNRTVNYEVIVPPSLGRLMMESNSPGIFKVVSSFTQDDINNTRVFYEHTHQFSDLYANDSFVFNVKSHLAKPLTKRVLKIDISVSSGGLDSYINIPKISVDEGGMVNIALNFSEVMEFLENHSGLRSPIIHVSASSPQFGQLLLKDQSNQNFTISNVFTQQQLEAGLVYYHHDHSDSVGDNIHLSLYLIPHYITLCNVTIPIVVNPVNDQPFHLVTPTPSLNVVQGENFTITKNELETEDADTPPSKLKYVVISGPNQGKLVLVPENTAITHFTQGDIDQNRLVYVHNTSVLVDSFHFRVWDDKFRPQFRVFNINILPITLKISPGLPLYIQQGADTVFLTEKQFFIKTNADKSKLKYKVKREAKHGMLYVKNSPSNVFSQTDLENENVMYIQTDMTTANDSFGVVGEIVSSNTSFSCEADVHVNVQPLMQLKNFTAVTGEYNRITLHVLDASPLAKLTNSNPRYTILKVPKYSKVKRVIRNSGDKRKVLDSVITSFTHDEIQSGLIYLEVEDVELPWYGYEDKLVFMLAASIFQPAVGELRTNLKYSLSNNIHSTLPGPNDPAGHEGGFHVASPNMTKDYVLILTMAIGVVLLGVAVIIIIKCRTFDPLNLKEEQCGQPMPLPRPPDRLMSSSPQLKHLIDDYSQQMPALPQCKITPLSGGELEGSQVCYPYGVEDQPEEWSSCEASDPPCSNKNIMLRRNQYWV